MFLTLNTRLFGMDKTQTLNVIGNPAGTASEGDDAQPSPEQIAIKLCVEQFYGRARRDDLLGPIFNSTVVDWNVHLRVIENFWSNALLGTKEYKGSPFVHHMNLPVEIAHFTRWLELFEDTAKQTLPQALADKALAKANHMAESFKAGIFPFLDKDGNPSRHPH
jgi:hemoglobin